MERPPPLAALLALQAVLTVVLMVAFIAVVSSSADEAARAVADDEFWITAGALFLGSCVLQAAVLSPIRRTAPRKQRGTSVWLSLGVGALMFGLLLAGFVLAAIDAIRAPGADASYAIPVALSVATSGWIGGLVLMATYLRRHPTASREQVVHLMAKRLLQGTAFETFAVVPFDVMIRQKHDCYCVAGTVFAWAICFAVGVVVLGPAVLLPTLMKQRERWYRERCDSCALPVELADTHVAGYRGPVVDRCPRCGGDARVREAS